MKRFLWTNYLLFALLFCSFGIRADPWFTGPLLIDSAESAPLGSAGVALAFGNSNSPAIYDFSGHLVNTPLAMSNSVDFDFGYGLTSAIDFGAEVIYIKNQTEGLSRNGFGDTALELGYQVLTQGNSHYRPNFRIAVAELFPTGRYAQLNPNLYATDAFGIGSYQTSVGLNFDLLTQFRGTSHYLKAAGSITGILSSTTKIRGINVYGGDRDTLGYINPGSAITLNLAAEYTLTQNWVVAFETFVLAQKASVFNGFVGSNPASFDAFITENIERNRPGSEQDTFKKNRAAALNSNHIRPSLHNIGNKQRIGSGNLYLLELAPELEYNFTDSFGVIGGVAFTAEGRNAPYYVTSTLEFIISW